MNYLRIALAQINPSVGDISANAKKIISVTRTAAASGADLIAFPELSVTGYPPEDLILRDEFVSENISAVDEIITNTPEIVSIFGYVDRGPGRYNAAAIAYSGNFVSKYRKIFLPNYGVFDEKRYFNAGNECPVCMISGVSVGVNICEDIWYPVGPTGVQRLAGAELIININGSPFFTGKRQQREQILIERAKDHEVFIAYVNQVGGQDELVFDGGSLVIGPNGEVLSRGKQFEEDLLIYDIDIDQLKTFRDKKKTVFSMKGLEKIGSPIRFFVSDVPKQNKKHHPISFTRPLDKMAELKSALVLGTRDYVKKSGFGKILIALSGGIDSSLVAVLAVEAVGNNNVTGISMPSQFSSDGSRTDAKQLANNLGIELITLPISDIYDANEKILHEAFARTTWGLAEENLQSRIRGNLIMAMSNKFNRLVLTTGNKSEMAVGYSTIYGDMAGGFAVIKDVPKTVVYQLSNHINSESKREIIPQSVIDKPPSAELRPDQKDSDSLPDYEVLDVILQHYVEKDMGLNKIIALGFEEKTVRSIIQMVDRNEYKRRQSAPGVKISPKNFGRDRRMPIANQYTPY
jgi:NAD+ synthase (glutamine-hydrolysing)